MNNQVKMVLLGRHGCGKTAVIGSFRGTSITQPTSSLLADNVHTVTKHDSNISIIETTRLFAEGQDIKANKMRLAESVYTFTPGPDAFGLVVRIGRFTPEVRTMIDTLRETFGEDMFRFTVLIFTRLDDLKYDGITLEKYLQESTPELKSVLNACGGRYIGFDNTGTWESRAEDADKLLYMLRNLQKQNNNMVYTVAMLEYATRCQQKKEEEDRNQQDERNRNIKEELKSTMRQELEEQIRREMQAEQRKAVSLLTSNTQQTYITTGCKPRKLQTQIYTRQTVESADTFNERIPKKGGNRSQNERGPRPELKPKPTTRKVQENIISRDTHEQDAVWVCANCYQNNDAANDRCQVCGTSKMTRNRTVKRDAQRTSPPPPVQAPPPPPLQMVDQVYSKPTQKVARVNPIPKPSRHGIELGELRLVLLGKTGAGKSATANTIMNKKVFDSRSSMTSVTEKCQFVHGDLFGNTIQIVDTPGLFDTNTKKGVIDTEIKKCIALSAPGPHAFLLVSSLTNRFTEEEGKVFDEIDDMFGEQVLNYMVIVFTGRDQIEPKTVKKHIEGAPDKLKQILSNAGGGYVTFNNRGKAPEKEADVKCLIKRIKDTVNKNGGKHFASKMFQEAEEIIQERIKRVLADKEKEMRREIEEELREEMKEYYEKLHESNVKEMEDLKLQLKGERDKHARKRSFVRENERTMEELVQSEMEMRAKKNKLVQQLQKADGKEKVQMQHQLANVGEEVMRILAERKRVEDEVTNDRFSAECNMRAKQVRETERENIQNEDEATLRRFATGMKNMGRRFLKLFK